jgi:hypothetical protein
MLIMLNRKSRRWEITICSIIKKVKLFFMGFFQVPLTPTRTRDKTVVFSTRTKNKVEKLFYFFIGHEVLFNETAFSASALEHWVQITLRQRRWIGLMPIERPITGVSALYGARQAS